MKIIAAENYVRQLVYNIVTNKFVVRGKSASTKERQFILSILKLGCLR